ncbi:hypothetical protein [Acinetobacter sp. A47]|uniref:hypothetical protein n=1 Tax=Acinetobacter sp. A47 TaxID=1561217 RepID=UPI00056F48EF|nr:hypothetical protein [Acinetobacter sp. A47]
MSQGQTPENGEEIVYTQDERATLIQQATMLGIQFHPNIGTDTLRERVQAKLKEHTADLADGHFETSQPVKTSDEHAARMALRDEANKLIRVRVTCMDPMKKEFQGEYYTVANSEVGTIRKYVLFNEEYHLPNFIVKQLQAKTCQIFVTKKNDRGVPVRTGKSIKAYSVEILPQLTKDELAELAADQRARKAID